MKKKKKRAPCSGAEAIDVTVRCPETKKRFQWKSMGCVKEDHRQAIYAMEFCGYGPRHERFFATVGANRATVYECMEDGSIEVIQAYISDDVEEMYFSCAWSIDEASSHPLLAFAGLRGVIKVLDCSSQTLAVTLLGHGNSINHLVFHPVDPALLLSVSKDESLRLWNTVTGCCIAIFAGHRGHRDEVLYADIQPLGNCFASCGMDNTVKIWALETDRIQSAIAKSYTHLQETPEVARKSFSTLHIQFPVFSTSKVHSDYIDCVKWVGNLLMSKSTGNKVVLWKPNTQRRKDAVTILREYSFHDAKIWFVRFGLDVACDSLVVGNRSGKVFIWELDGSSQPIKLTHPHCKTTVRQAAFSPNGRTVIYCCEDSTVWRWDKA